MLGLSLFVVFVLYILMGFFVRNIPFPAVYWMNYEYLKKVFMTKLFDKDRLLEKMEQIVIAFGSGAVSGMIAAAITTPFDVLKTRRQVTFQSEGS
jgi:solute carrier family 25, member 39/40